MTFHHLCYILLVRSLHSRVMGVGIVQAHDYWEVEIMVFVLGRGHLPKVHR